MKIIANRLQKKIITDFGDIFFLNIAENSQNYHVQNECSIIPQTCFTSYVP